MRFARYISKYGKTAVRPLRSNASIISPVSAYKHDHPFSTFLENCWCIIIIVKLFDSRWMCFRLQIKIDVFCAFNETISMIELVATKVIKSRHRTIGHIYVTGAQG